MGGGGILASVISFIGDSIYTEGTGVKTFTTQYKIDDIIEVNSSNNKITIKKNLSNAILSFSTNASMSDTYKLRVNGTEVLSITGTNSKTTTMNLNANDEIDIYRSATGTTNTVHLMIQSDIKLLY